MTTSTTSKFQVLAPVVQDTEESTRTINVAASVTISSPSDPTASQMLKLIEQSGVLDFWLDEADVYTDQGR